MVERSALVQGASRGIGLGLVRELLAREPKRPVIATCRIPADATELGALHEAHPDRLHVESLDVQDESSIAACADRLRRDGRTLDLLINSAGILHDETMQPEKRIENVEPVALARAFAVHASGPLLMAKHLHDRFAKNERAVFASLSARVASIEDNRSGGWYAYRASKAAQNMITRNLGHELGRRVPGLVCVGLHPGTVETDLSAPFTSRVPPERLFSVERAARQLLDVIEKLSPDRNGQVFAWDGSRIPW